MINTDCVEIKDWGHILDHVEYQISTQVWDNVWDQLLWKIHNQVRFKVFR